jgi:hypothetical protein
VLLVSSHVGFARVTKLPIGQPRLSAGDVMPVLYPGEIATARLDIGDAINALVEGVSGRDWMELPVREWLIEPMPGWKGRWLRLRYRVWGRWFSRGATTIETRITTTRTNT